MDSSASTCKSRKESIVESFASARKKVCQTDVDKAIQEFIVQGIHPLSTVEQPAFVKLISSKLFKAVHGYEGLLRWWDQPLLSMVS